MPNYYNDAGKKLEGDKLKKYLNALKKAEQTGKPYTGPNYMTREQLEKKYNGFDISIIRQAGNMRAQLLEMPKQYVSQTDEQMQATANAQAEADANTQTQQANTLYSANKATLEAQKAALDQPYQQQLQQNSRQTAQNVDSLTGSMASRGLMRSSFAGALQSNALKSGSDAANAILQEKAGKATAIDTQLANQGTAYNSALDVIGKNKVNSAKTAFDALKQQDYAKGMDISNARLAGLTNLLNLKKKISSSPSQQSSYSRSSNNSSNSSGNQQSGLDWLKDWLSLG